MCFFLHLITKILLVEILKLVLLRQEGRDVLVVAFSFFFFFLHFSFFYFFKCPGLTKLCPFQLIYTNIFVLAEFAEPYVMNATILLLQGHFSKGARSRKHRSKYLSLFIVGPASKILMCGRKFIPHKLHSEIR